MTSPPRSKFSNLKPELILLGALLLLGLALRLIRLDFQPLWWDEGYSVWFAGQPLADMVRLTAEDIHPPLYYALLHAWSALLGLSPIVLRIFSVLVAVLSIPLAYLAGRDMEDRWAGLIAAAFVAINGFAIYYSQEIRMYGLAGVFSLAALWTGWRWAQPGAKRGFGIAYALSILAGMYTLYLFALLPLAQTIWVLWMKRDRLRAWFIALAAAVLLYLPWLIYAGPKLLNYVAYKVVQDNDQPLSLLPYFGRHLSAFLVGHLEGALAPLWPWVLLLILPPAIALTLSLRSSPSMHGAEAPTTNAPSPSRPLAYLTLALLLPLTIGFIQQLRAPFIPDRFERVLLFAAPALWLLIAIGLRRLARESLAAAILTAMLLLIANVASLWSFYITPRYVELDYRPLISSVQQHLSPDDSIFTIFPWQTGYFWAYLPAGYHDNVVPSPSPAWGTDVQDKLDDLLDKGDIWFPEHRALGAVLETAVEDYLGQHSYQVLNRWHGAETRLTAWSSGSESDPVSLTTPVSWSNGIALTEARLTASPQSSLAYLDLTWAGDRSLNPNDVTFSLWLTGLQGKRWAQRDVSPFAHPSPSLDTSQIPWTNTDSIALFIPPGTPPGEYDIWTTLLDGSQQPVALAGDNPAPQAWLGTHIITAAAASQAHVIAQFPQPLAGEQIDSLGYDRSSKAQLPGDDLNISLYWLPSVALAPDHYLFLQLLDAQGQVVAGMEEPPISWLPTSQWSPNSPIRSQHSLRIPAALEPGDYALIAGLFDPATGLRQLWGGDDHLSLGEVKISARTHDFSPPSPQQPLKLTLAGEHQLVGYDLIAGDSPGSPINLVIYWRAADPTDIRYSAFVHLLDSDDAILDQSDQQPAAGDHPTTSWLTGEYIADAHTLTIPLDVGSTPTHLALGLYDPITGQRLPFIDEQGNIITDHIVLPLPRSK